MTTTKLTLKTARHGLLELEPERILCNDVHLPFGTRAFNPHNVRLWVVGNEYGAMGAVWAGCEQDALDELVDAGLGDALLITAEDEARMEQAEREELAHLGNAGESADLTNCWMATVDLAGDVPLMLLFAEARGANVDALGDL